MVGHHLGGARCARRHRCRNREEAEGQDRYRNIGRTDRPGQSQDISYNGGDANNLTTRWTHDGCLAEHDGGTEHDNHVAPGHDDDRGPDDDHNHPAAARGLRRSER